MTEPTEFPLKSMTSATTVDGKNIKLIFRGPDYAPKAPADVHMVENVELVATEAGAVTLRIYPLGEAPRDILFRREHLQFALDAILQTYNKPSGPDTH